jgi:Escherichia/Staphylococcus phage prohead protease
VNRPKPGTVEERTAPDLLTSEDRRIRGVVPYSIESRDLGGFREIIMPRALDGAKLDDLVVTVDHAGVPLGRYPGTLELEDRDDGLHWCVSPPESRADVREAVERGDLRAGSWRMRVKRDSWDGDLRRVHEIAELRDVSIVTAPTYEAALVELRSQPDPGEAQEAVMGTEPEKNTETATAVEPTTEGRTAGGRPPGGLQVEDPRWPGSRTRSRRTTCGGSSGSPQSSTPASRSSASASRCWEAPRATGS